MMSTLFGAALAVAVTIVTVIVAYTRHKFNYWQRLGLPIVQPSFPFGNFGATFRQKTSFGDRTLELYRQSTGQACVGLWTGLRPVLMVRDPELIRTILIKDFAAFQDRGIYSDPQRDPLSGHLFALAGDEWRHLRQKLSPTFTSGKLKSMFQTLVACGGPLERFVKEQADQQNVVEMRELLAQFTTNIIASVAFGLDIDCIADPETAFRRFGRKVFEPSFLNSFRNAVSFFLPKWFALLRLRAVDADVEEFFMSVVAQNMRLRETGGETRKDFFQLLVQLRNTGLEDDGVWQTRIAHKENKQLSVEQCAAQSFVFYVAGFETSSTTIGFALYELAKNVECQRKVQREIDEVLARHDGQLTYEAVSDMKYLEMCIDETLRKYPPVPLLNRECNKAWTIPGSGGVRLEPGTPIIIPAYALQMDAKYYADPERFDPERFAPEHQRSFVDQPYLPFGEGPRNCIGLRLGKIQTKVGLIVMLQRFGYELAGNTLQPLQMNASSFLLTPVGGVNLRVVHRT